MSSVGLMEINWIYFESSRLKHIQGVSKKQKRISKVDKMNYNEFSFLIKIR